MKVIDLSMYDGEDRVISSKEMDRLLQDQDYLFTVKSKLPTLDSLVEGFVPGELIVVSGLTKNGKTLLCQTLTKNFYDQHYLSLWFSFELPPKQFLRCFPELPLLYLPKMLKSSNMKWLEERIIESLQKHHTRIVFIDHLHYVVDIARQRNPSLEIGTVVRRLKLLAVRENLIVFLLCHTQKPRKEMSNDDFGDPRDSSFVEQESDCALMVKRFPMIESNIACIKVNQHRRTGVMQEKVWVEKIDGYIRETSEREIPDEKKRKKKKYWEDD